MSQFLATFHTHFSAMQTCKNLKAAGLEARMCPVPRCLSASCGTCVRFSTSDLEMSWFHQDFEEIYEENDDKYTKIQGQ